MIYDASPKYQIDRLTILGDYPDPLQFYCFPVAPRLALNPDGSPTFLFVKYRQDLSALPPGAEPGGGFLVFDVDLRVDQDELDNAAREIKRRKNLDQTPRLVPLEYRTGKTKLVFLDYQEPPPADAQGSSTDQPTPPATPPAQPRFVERATYYATPSLYGDNRATFSVQLSPQGATLVQDALDAKTSLVGVVFDLTFVALRPAYSVHISIDWNRVYDYMESEFKAGFLFFSADIDNATEKLIENRVIQIDVVSYGAGAADADIITDKDEAVKYVKQFITEKFFEPSISPKEAQSDSWYRQVGALRSELSPTGSFGFTSKHLHRDDVKSLALNMSERSGEERRIVPQAHLSGLMNVLKQYPPDAYIRMADLADQYFQKVQVDVIGGGAMTTDHTDHVQVHFEYGPDGAKVPQDVVLTTPSDKGHVQWALDPSVGLNYTYRYEVFLKPDAPPGKSDHLVSPTLTSNSSKLVIDPRDLYQVQKVHAQAVNMDFTRYSQCQVDLHYEDTDAGFSLDYPAILTQGSPSADWTFRYSDPTKIQYKYQITYYPVGAQPIRQDWQETIDPVVLVPDPYPNVLKVTVSPVADFTKIQAIMVELNYNDTANNIFQDDLLTFTQSSSIQVWSAHIADRTKRDYTYHITVQYKDGTIKDIPPLSSTDSVIFAGDSVTRTFRMTVSAFGHSFSDAALAKVRVRLAYDDDANQIHDSKEVTLTSLDDKFDWSFEMKNPALDTYTYSVTYFGADGFQRNDAAKQSNTQQLVIPIQ